MGARSAKMSSSRGASSRVAAVCWGVLGLVGGVPGRGGGSGGLTSGTGKGEAGAGSGMVVGKGKGSESVWGVG
jgi:hypothetical protein